MKIKIKEFQHASGSKEDLTIELQEMDNLLFFDVYDLYKRGTIPFSQFAAKIIADCVVSPIEAKKVRYFKKHVKALDKLCGAVITKQIGATKEAEVDLVEE